MRRSHVPALRHPLYPPPINPLQRGMVREVLETGIRAIDTLLTLGRGQRVGIFAGSGVGKSTVLGMLAREVKADVSVIALIGERGREVRAFVEEGLSEEARSGRGRGRRHVGPAAAGAAARGIPGHGRRRTFPRPRAERLPHDGFGHARRDGAARDRPRGGRAAHRARLHAVGVHAAAAAARARRRAQRGGSITALYTVLVEGDDVNEPISDAVRSILDGHIVLSRDIAHRGRYPAIDVTRSISRLASALVTRAGAGGGGRCGQAHWRRTKPRATSSRSGAYRAGTTPAVDRAIQLMPALEQFLAQRPDETESRAAACERLERLLAAEVQDSKARLPRPTVTVRVMTDRRTQRLDLLYRLREMHVEQARADHVAAQTELEAARAGGRHADRGCKALDEWTVGQLVRRRAAHSGGAAPGAAVSRRREAMRSSGSAPTEEKSREAREGRARQAHARFEELSVVERLAIASRADRHDEQIRARLRRPRRSRDQRKTLEAKE